MTLTRVACAAALIACGVPIAAAGQGFQLNEIGSCAVGRGQAVTGATCADPSLIYWNPGATTTLSGWTAYVGAAAIDVGGGFTADTSGTYYPGTVPVTVAPHAFVNYTSKDHRWALGVGAYVPYGLTSEWNNDFIGKFEAQKASLYSVYIQPNFAIRFAKGWSIGGGPVLGYSHVELRQALDLAPQVVDPTTGTTFGNLGIAAGTEFAMAKLSGSTTAWGFDVGIHGQLGPDWEIGARYLSSITFNYNNADATFAQVQTGLVLAADNPLGLPANTPIDALVAPYFTTGQPLSSQKVSTSIKHPAQVQVGLGFTGLVNTIISGDFEWTQFSSFSTLPVKFDGPAGAAGLDRTLIEDYTNSWSMRFGLEHRFAVGVKGRAGFTYVKTPAPDATVTPLLPDMNRRNYTLGLGIPLNPTYTLDAGYLHVDTSGRRGRVVERTSINETAAMLNSGFYQLHADIFSLSVRANF